MKGVEIPERELRRLYLKEKLSSCQIAKKYDCEKGSVLLRMKRFGIKPRSKSETSRMIIHPIKYNISKKELIELYYKNRLSIYQIARICGCSPSAIFHKMKKIYKIPLRENREAINLTIERRSRNVAKSITKYNKNDFSGNMTEKAYLIGFRLGDLYVSKRKYGQTVMVQTWTTKKTQIELLRKMFENYGHLYLSEKPTGQIQFACNLNSSFDFLLRNEDEIDKWILDDDGYFIAFLAGYIDAEGSFGVYGGHAEFSIKSQQKNIINSIYSKLKEINISMPQPRIEVNAGYTDKRGVENRKDIWGLKIRREAQLLKFIRLIKPHFKHAKRLKDAEKVENHLKNKLEASLEVIE